MRVAIVGCGFVADYYLKTLPLHPELELMGVMDKESSRAEKFATMHDVHQYQSLEELLDDERVEMVLNLTNPRNHFEISKAALEKNKHVYSEKPLAMNMEDATDLVEMAKSRDLLISSAPCSLLSETAQTLWHALRNDAVGKVRVVYAEMDDGMVHLMPYDKWKSESGVPWPYKDEFEIGCTLEHAGYYLAWLVAYFGPAKKVTSFASIQVPDKLTKEPLNMESPDFSVACVEFENGVVARLTCSILAPHDHELKIVGDEGVLYTKDAWHYYSPVYARKMISIRRKTLLNPLKKRFPLKTGAKQKIQTKGAQYMDFSRGVAEMAGAIKDGRDCRVSADYSLHVNEIALAIHYARENGSEYQMTTRFDPIDPMPWAK